MARNNMTASQYGTFLLSTVAAVCLMNLAPIFAKLLDRQSWIAILFITVITFFLLIAAAFFVKKTGYSPISQVFSFSLGRGFGKFSYFLFTVYLFILACFSLRIFTYIVNLYYLPQTPLLVVTLLLMLPTAYGVYSGIRGYGHTTTMLYYILPCFMLFFLLTKDNYTFSYLFPLTQGNIGQVFRYLPSLFVTAFALLSPFVFLPHISNPNKIKKHILLFAVFSCILMLFVYAIGKTYFGDALNDLLLPFHNLSTPYKGRVLERLDVLYILVFVPVLGLYGAAFFTTFFIAQKQVFTKSNKNHPVGTLCILSVLIVLVCTYTPLPFGIWDMLLWENIINLGVFALLLLIYIIAFFKRRRNHEI